MPPPPLAARAGRRAGPWPAGGGPGPPPGPGRRAGPPRAGSWVLKMLRVSMSTPVWMVMCRRPLITRPQGCAAHAQP